MPQVGGLRPTRIVFRFTLFRDETILIMWEAGERRITIIAEGFACGLTYLQGEACVVAGECGAARCALDGVRGRRSEEESLLPAIRRQAQAHVRRAVGTFDR